MTKTRTQTARERTAIRDMKITNCDRNKDHHMKSLCFYNNFLLNIAFVLETFRERHEKFIFSIFHRK